MSAQRRFDSAWARRVETAFQAAVGRSFSHREVVSQLQALGCSLTTAEGPFEVWRTSNGKPFTVPSGTLPASLFKDLLLTVRELDRSKRA